MQACSCALLLLGKRASGRHYFAGLLAAINRRSCQLLSAANCAGVVRRCRQRFSAGLIQAHRRLVEPLYSPLAARLLFLRVRYYCCCCCCCKSLGKTNARTHTQSRRGVVGLCSTDEETSGPETPFTAAPFTAATSPEVVIRPRRTASQDSDV